MTRFVRYRAIGLAILLFLGILLPLNFHRFAGTSDVAVDLGWIAKIEAYGQREGYIEIEDSYPPIIPVLLFATAKIGRIFGLPDFLSFKTALLAFLFLTTVVTFLWTRNIWIAVMVHFAVLLNSVALAYLDIFMAPTFIASLWALHRKRLALFSALFTITCFIKFQPLIIVPFIVVYLNSKSSKVIASLCLPAMMILGIFFSVFGSEIFAAFNRALFWHAQLSANALNLNWIVTYILHIVAPQRYGALFNGQSSFIMMDDSNWIIVPRLIYLLFYLYVVQRFRHTDKSLHNLLQYSLLGFLTYFTFNSGVHENHLFLAMLLGIFLCWLGDSLPIAIALMLLANLNLVLFYGVDGSGLKFHKILAADPTLLVSILTVVLFTLLFVRMVRRPSVESPFVSEKGLTDLNCLPND